ncbi:MAG: amidohydrolase family protein [Eubacteriales bacterium]|nr:amidohydrolase family protein [Eubacteriales bacterium]
MNMVLKNANVLTMDTGAPKARWVAVKNGIIEAIGSRDDFSGEVETVIDLQGKTLMPGFIDSHCHVSSGGLILANAIDVMGRVKSLKDLLDIIKEECEKETGDKIMLFVGVPTFDCIEERRYPTRWELDKVANGHKVALFLWSMHGGIASSAMLDCIPLSGEIKEEVEPNGIFDSNLSAFYCMGYIQGAYSEKEIAGFYQFIADLQLAAGVTRVHSLDGMAFVNDCDIDVFLKIQEQLPIHFVEYAQTFDLKKVRDRYQFPRIGGCLSIDGAPGQLTIANVEPFPIQPSSRGLLGYSDEQLYNFVSAAHASGMQCAFHAIGERAIDQILYIYDRVIKEQGQNGLHHRIEHFIMPSDLHVEMAAELGIRVALQPLISDGWSDKDYMQWLPKEKAQKAWKMQRLLDAGINISSSSDCPCSPIDALGWIEALVNAKDPKRRVSIDDALRMNTINGAVSGNHQKESGSIEPGKNGDFVVLSKDPYAVKGSFKDEISVEMTIASGKVVYENQSDVKSDSRR